MVYAHIRGGAVQRLYEPPAAFAALQLSDLMAPEVAAEMVPVPAGMVGTVREGWLYVDQTFSAPPASTPPVVVPSSVTAAQARATMAALILPDGRSLLTATEEWLAAGLAATAHLPESDPQRIAARQADIWWEYGQVVERRHPLLIQFASTISMEDQQIDALFIAAAQRG